MVAVRVTPEILSVLRASAAESAVDRGHYIDTVSHAVLARTLRSIPADAPSLSSLLRASELHRTHADAVAAHAPPPRRDPKLEARVARLKARLEESEYAHMVRDVSRAAGSNAELESRRMSKLAPQMSLGANVIVTMATCFVAGYFVFKNSSGSETVGLIGGIAGLIIAMAVEATLLVTRMYTLDDALDKQLRKRNRTASKGSEDAPPPVLSDDDIASVQCDS